jgi:5-methylcytosine-specific restriction endonuclease McrA
VITRGGSEVLDVGRRTAVVSAAMRRALITRDGGCAFPCCDRPHQWCDAHHVVHWADGGETRLDNLVLLCRPHHRMLHKGFAVDAERRFFRPDGTEIEHRRPP